MIGEKIKELRVKSGISAEQVADFLGVSPATIYRYENGDISKMPAKFVKPLAEYLNSTPAELMGWTDIILPASKELSSDETYLVDIYRKASPESRKNAVLILEASAHEREALRQESGNLGSA